jgi:hypothetical protein
VCVQAFRSMRRWCRWGVPIEVLVVLHHPPDLRHRPLATDRGRRPARPAAAADQRVSRRRAAHRRRARGISGREPEGHRRDRRLTARTADERRRGHALHVLAGHLRRCVDADDHLCARHRPRQRAGAGAEPRRPDAAPPAAGRAADRRHHREGVAGLHHGRAPGLARRALRHALPVELCAPAGEGRAVAAARRRRGAGVRRGRVQHAGLARSGSAGLAPAHRHRRRPRDPRAERAGRGRRAGGAPGAVRRHISAVHQHSGASHHGGRIRQHRGPRDRWRADHAAVRCRPSRARLQPLFAEEPARQQAGGGDRRLPAPGYQRPSGVRRRSRDDGTVENRVSSGRGLPHRLRPDGLRA